MLQFSFFLSFFLLFNKSQPSTPDLSQRLLPPFKLFVLLSKFPTFDSKPELFRFYYFPKKSLKRDRRNKRLIGFKRKASSGGSDEEMECSGRGRDKENWKFAKFASTNCFSSTLRISNGQFFKAFFLSRIPASKIYHNLLLSKLTQFFFFFFYYFVVQE